jgi:hypothetical protein
MQNRSFRIAVFCEETNGSILTGINRAGPALHRRNPSANADDTADADRAAETPTVAEAVASEHDNRPLRFSDANVADAPDPSESEFRNISAC